MKSLPHVLSQQVGQSIRTQRQQKKITQAELAQRSGISLRFLGQVEAGTGNISLDRLDSIATALGLSPWMLLQNELESTSLALLTEVGDLLQHHRQEDVRQALELARSLLLTSKGQRIALLGIRGAGKTTVGIRLARRLKLPFFELDVLIEKQAGLTLGAIFELHGEEYYRRLEHRVLLSLFERPSFVVATGGSLVTDPEHYSLLKRLSTTIWLKATPEDLWARVVAQGDGRPMRNKPQAMDDLRTLCAARQPLYEQASLVFDTHEQEVEEVIVGVQKALAALSLTR